MDMRASLVVIAMLVGWPLVAADPDPEWEANARQALVAGDAKALRQLAAEYRKLAPEVRTVLPVRIRDDAVEFAFRGEFRGDQYSVEMLEYLVSGPGKDYETLVVASDAEQQRVQALRSVFEGRTREGHGQTWSARLVWVDGETPHGIDLADLLLPATSAERTEFLDRLGVNEFGLGGSTNVKTDAGVLPRKRVPVRLYLTVRLAAKNG
jgi:hypothetical protein